MTADEIDGYRAAYVTKLPLPLPDPSVETTDLFVETFSAANVNDVGQQTLLSRIEYLRRYMSKVAPGDIVGRLLTFDGIPALRREIIRNRNQWSEAAEYLAVMLAPDADRVLEVRAASMNPLFRPRAESTLRRWRATQSASG